MAKSMFIEATLYPSGDKIWKLML